MSDALKPPLHGRDHLPGGADPIPLNSLVNDWCQADGAFSCPTSTSVSTPNLTSVGFTSLDRTSDSAGNIYIPTATTIPSIVIGEPGGYRVQANASFPQGKNGYCNVAAVIAGDAWLGSVWAPQYVPLSYPGNVGGGVVTYEQDIEVLSSAVVGTFRQVGLYLTVWQSSGLTLTGIATVKITRLT